MTTNVTVFPLGDLCHIVGGGTPSKDRADYYIGDIPWATVRDMRSEVIANTEFRITSAAVAASATNIIPAGNVVIATRVGLGKVCLIERPTAINQDLRGVIPRDSQQLVVKYLFWWLKSVAHLIEKEGIGATVQGVKLPFIKSLGLPLRSVAEQRRIVSILDEAFEALATAEANAERSLRNARELFESHLESLFVSSFSDWPERPLEKLADIINGHAFKSTDFQRDLGVKSIKITNVGVREFVDDVGNCLPATFAQPHGDVAVAKGSIVLALTRTIIAGGLKVAVVPEHFHGALLNQRVAAVQPHAAELDTPFLFAYLSTRRVMNYVKARVNTLMQPNLSIADLKSLPVPLPSLVEQRYLVTKLTRLQHSSQKLESVYLRMIIAVNELKKSLLHQAFTGQLTSVKQTSVALHPALRTTTPEFTANVIALAHAQHERQKRDKTFGHVKAQKVLHLVESVAKIDLGRRPIKDAAGPNDFAHMLKAEDWARAHNFFDMVKRGEGYEFQKLSAFDAHLTNARRALAPYLPQLDRVIDLLVPMDTDWAQVVTTVHAAWNNLLIDGAEVTDDAIVRAAREDWHAAKLRIQLPKFHSAIDLIRRQGIVPDGTAKYVGGQRSLL